MISSVEFWHVATVLGPLILVVACAAVLRGFTGFGFGLFAVPLMSLILAPAKAVPMVMILQFVSGAATFSEDRKDIDVPSAKYLLLAGLPFAAVGAMALNVLPMGFIRVAIGAITIIAALVLWRQRPSLAPRPRSGTVLLAGTAAGFLQGFTAMAGPPLAIFYLGGSFSPAAARASMTFVFSILSLCPLLYSAIWGELSVASVVYSVILIPILLGATRIGAILFRKFPGKHRNAAVLTLAAVGVVSIIRSI